MSPFADPSLPVYARIVLALLFAAMLVALTVAVGAILMSADHPALLFVRIGLALGITVLGMIWERRRKR